MNEILRKAENLHKSGDLDGALSLYRVILEEDGGAVDAVFGIATLFSQQEKYKEACEYFDLAMSLEPGAEDIIYNYAICLQRMGAPNKALAQICMIKKRSIEAGPLEYSLAKAFVKLGELENALRALNLIATLDSKATLFKARIHGMKGEWGTASHLLKLLVEHVPEQPAIHRELALAAGRFRDYETALAAFRRYLDLIEPEYNDYIAMADLCLMARDTESCKDALALSLVKGRPTADYYGLQARILRLDGLYEQAVECAQKAVALMPGNGQAWSIIAEKSEVDQLCQYQMRMEKALAEGGVSSYNHIHLRYAMVELFHRSEKFKDAIDQMHIANRLERELLKKAGDEYDQTKSAAHFAKIKEQFLKLPDDINTNAAVPRLIFIVGMPRSGTTLIERVLGQVPGVCNSGENEAMAFVAHQYTLDVSRGRLPLPSRMSRNHWREMAERYLDRSNKIASVVTDKLPHNVQNAGLIMSCFPNAKIIQLRRDPRDVCLSIYQRSFPSGHGYACSLKDLAHFYSLTDDLMDHWSAICPEQVLDVNYQKFVRHPKESIKRVLEFVKLPWDDACLDFHKNVKKSFTFSEMQVRQPLSVSSIARWKKYEPYLGELISALMKNEVLKENQ